MELGHSVTDPMPNTRLTALIEAISLGNLASSHLKGKSSATKAFSAVPHGVRLRLCGTERGTAAVTPHAVHGTVEE